MHAHRLQVPSNEAKVDATSEAADVNAMVVEDPSGLDEKEVEGEHDSAMDEV